MFYSIKEFFDYVNTDTFALAFFIMLVLIGFILFILIWFIEFCFNYSDYKEWKNREKEREDKIRLEVEKKVRKKLEEEEN